jgi:hypothetical protein
LLEPLFMQISGVSLTLTWPLRVCLLRVLLCVSHCYKLSPFQAHWRRWHCTCFLRPGCLFTVHMGSGSSPLSCGVSFHPHFYKLSRSWLLSVCHCFCLLQLACCEGFPLLPPQCSGHPALFATCLFCCLLFSFSFFPGWGVSLSRGLSWSGPELSVGIPCAT